MRTTFIETLNQLAKTDPNIHLICGDLGFSVLESFATAFPDRFLNAGVAEQNMTGMAAGIASTGKTVFTYSIANFPVVRCLEQVRNDVCYHNLNVKVVGVGAGFAYGALGYSHHGLEDLSMLRALPNMTILSPCDPRETKAAVQFLTSHHGPAYLRLGKAGEQNLHEDDVSLQRGKAVTLKEGTDVCIIGTGSVLGEALKAREDLAQHQISCQVVSMPFITPFDEAFVLEQAKTKALIVTLEEHGKGGLGSAVAETLAQLSAHPPLVPLYAKDLLPPLGGSQATIREQAGLSSSSIAQNVLTNLPANRERSCCSR